MVTSAPVLALYDPNKKTILSVDPSSHSIGAVLMKVQENGERKPIAYKSRALAPTERCYAQIKKEALAFTWARENMADYLLGLHFHIETNHKPLVLLFSPKNNRDELPLRVQRFRLRMVRYSFSISHVPGKSLIVADNLSHTPPTTPTTADVDFEQDVFFHISSTGDGCVHRH